MTTPSVPPQDTNGELQQAAVALRRCRKELERFPPEWRLWIAQSLLAGLEAEKA